MNPKKRVRRDSFSLPLPPVILTGALLSAIFFGLIITGPLDYSLLRRYCTNHPVAIACVCLFLVGLVTLGIKWKQALVQSNVMAKVAAALRRLTGEGAEVVPAQRSEWLAANWSALPASVRDSWLGLRLSNVVEMQISRGRRHQLESDLQALSDADADRQHESYSLLRIINWSMPMLGFLGTVLGISQTLGQLDTEMLASQSQEAMNELTAGLYVAFDTTAIALILTVTLMFLQFAVSRLETNLLSAIDAASGRELIEFLGDDPYNAQTTLLAPVRDMATDLLSAIRELTQEQADIWSASLHASQKQWADWTSIVTERIEQGLGESLEQTIGGTLQEHVVALEKLQGEAHSHLDKRWQQWQTTLSDQARIIHSQQKETIQQTETLHKLVESTGELRKLEDVIQDSVARLETISRIEDATVCMSEAVAVLATSLERAGVIRGAPLKPRASKTKAADSVDQRASLGETRATLPIDRDQPVPQTNPDDPNSELRKAA